MYTRIVPILLILLLLMPAGAVHAVPCPDAPPPGLLPGMSGVVAPGITGLRLRALPALGAGLVLSLNAGTRFIVLAGPSCNSDYNWWRVRVVGSGGQTGWLAEGTWQQAFVLPESAAPPAACQRAANPWAHAFLTPLCYLGG